MLIVPRALASLLVLLLAVVSCSRPSRTAPGGGPSSTVSASSAAGTVAPQAGGSTMGAAGTTVVAEVNGVSILQSELDSRAATRLTRLQQEAYEIRKQALDELIDERLIETEAKKRGLSRDELLKREVEAKAKPSSSEVESVYEKNKDRFPGVPRDKALARITSIFAERAQAERKASYGRELRERAGVVVRLEPPRVAVAVPKDAPALGPENARVSIVEFTDYQCPYCHRAQGVIDQVLARYEGKVRLVHMDFPLDGHPGARPAARGARCAGEQGRFWEYHRDLMLTQGALDDADLKGRAGKLRLDAAAFASCLASERHDAAIDGSFRRGEELGVTGTPAYFVNGRMVSGARPLEDFTELIDSELSRR